MTSDSFAQQKKAVGIDTAQVPKWSANDLNFFLHGSMSTEVVPDLFDTSTRGNSNSGHNYGTALTADEKRDLLEYLKTL